MPLSFDDIDYPLPEHLIATHPTEQRTQSRLMHVSPRNQSIEHRTFSDILSLLRHGDLLVFNNSRVIKARLLGQRREHQAEMLLVEKIDDTRWKALVKHSRKFHKGDVFTMPEVTLRVQDVIEDGMRMVEFERPVSFEDIDRWGTTPLPPYILKKRKDSGMPLLDTQDPQRYQSVLARYDGSVAAPTASLHFTPELLDQAREKGVSVTELTLHIGPGTFKPVEGRIEDYQIHREWVEVPSQAVEAIQQCRQRGGRVVAVGTTVVRSLETAAYGGKLSPFNGHSRLFITPPYDFKVVNALITNFHMPRSTLLLLVYAFGGVELLKKAYQTAIQESYRFFSYGDAMFIGD